MEKNSNIQFTENQNLIQKNSGTKAFSKAMLIMLTFIMFVLLFANIYLRVFLFLFIAEFIHPLVILTPITLIIILSPSIFIYIKSLNKKLSFKVGMLNLILVLIVSLTMTFIKFYDQCQRPTQHRQIYNSEKWTFFGFNFEAELLIFNNIVAYRTQNFFNELRDSIVVTKIRDYVEDKLNDGFNDYLVFQITLDVKKSGNYLVYAGIKAESDKENFCMHSIFQREHLLTGSQDIFLKFPGKEMKKNKYDGKIKLCYFNIKLNNDGEKIPAFVKYFPSYSIIPPEEIIDSGFSLMYRPIFESTYRHTKYDEPGDNLYYYGKVYETEKIYHWSTFEAV